MKSTTTVKKNYEFRRMYAKGKSGVSSCLVVYYRKNRLGHNRLGVTVSTKLGHAVVRNRVRRRIREIFRLSQGKMKQGYDCIVVARTRAAHADYWELKRCFSSGFTAGPSHPTVPPAAALSPRALNTRSKRSRSTGRSRAAGLPSSVSCGAIRSTRAEKSTTRSRDRT